MKPLAHHLSAPAQGRAPRPYPILPLRRTAHLILQEDRPAADPFKKISNLLDSPNTNKLMLSDS